jgi:hypothetical protein
MSRTSLCVVACVALCGGAFLAAPGQAPARQDAAPVFAQRVKQKWEYKAVNERSIVDNAAANAGGKSASEQRAEAWNKLGDEGWELVTVTDQGNFSSRTYYFKRPK